MMTTSDEDNDDDSHHRSKESAVMSSAAPRRLNDIAIAALELKMFPRGGCRCRGAFDGSTRYGTSGCGAGECDQAVLRDEGA